MIVHADIGYWAWKQRLLGKLVPVFRHAGAQLLKSKIIKTIGIRNKRYQSEKNIQTIPKTQRPSDNDISLELI